MKSAITSHDNAMAYEMNQAISGRNNVHDLRSKSATHTSSHDNATAYEEMKLAFCSHDNTNHNVYDENKLTKCYQTSVIITNWLLAIVILLKITPKRVTPL